LALMAIRGYQRYLSPHKGFVCAFRVHTGRDSCSAYGYRVIARYGMGQGIALLRRRLCACGEQYAMHTPTQPLLSPTLRHQGGFCDLPSCDIPSCELPSCDSAACDTLDVVGQVADCLKWDTPRQCGRRERYQISQQARARHKK
jgi:putative component of membrane protein insertase Oxa1/YidC/SpoIIIJ protein YidD